MKTKDIHSMNDKGAHLDTVGVAGSIPVEPTILEGDSEYFGSPSLLLGKSRSVQDSRDSARKCELGVNGSSVLSAFGKPVLLDPADYPLASQHRWWIRGGYVVGRIEGRDVRLHRFLLEPPTQMVVDHIDGDPLNNRRANLRVCRIEENLRNRRKTQKPTSSRFKGVWFAKAAAHTGKPWRAQCRVRGKVTYLGSFSTEEGAGLAYDLAAKREYGEFARLNFPEHHPLSRLALGGRTSA